MQAPSRWEPPSGTLGRITREAYGRVECLVTRRQALERAAGEAPPPPSLLDALRGGPVAIIAEVKRRSPSKGEIGPGLDAAALGRAYAEGGARAISVLTEPDHFGGGPDDVGAVASVVRLPILKKDFHVDRLQILEARALGASGMLFIARALPPATLGALVEAAFAAGVEPVVEVRSEAELRNALQWGARVIGVNNRDLETLAIDRDTVARILPRVPAACVAVAESGVRDRDDVLRAAEAGADAVLVGSMLSAAPDPAATVRALADVSRIRRRG